MNCFAVNGDIFNRARRFSANLGVRQRCQPAVALNENGHILHVVVCSSLTFDCVENNRFGIAIVVKIAHHHLSSVPVFFALFLACLTGDVGIDCLRVLLLERAYAVIKAAEKERE